jgi:hypothetical protein
MSNYSRQPVNFFPSNSVKLTVDKNKVRKNGIVSDSLSDDMINDQLNVKLPQQINKNTLAILDIVANNFEDRPIYMGQTIPNEFVNLFRNHIKTVGLAYFITPEKMTRETMYDIEKNYDLFMNKFRYRGLNDPKIYWDETANRTTFWYRQGFMMLASELLQKGDRERALKVLDKYDETFLPIHTAYTYGEGTERFIAYRYEAGDTVGANQRLEEKFNDLDKELKYYARFDKERQSAISTDIAKNINTLRDCRIIAIQYGNRELGEKITNALNHHKQTFPYIVQMYNIK